MKITKDLHGIIFNLFNYKENDLIVDVFCYEYGFMQLYVKGGQKTTSKSFFIFKLFNVISFDLFNFNPNGLSNYKSGSAVKVFDFTKLDYDKINVMMLICEVLLKIKHLKDNDYQKFYLDVYQIVLDIYQQKPFFTLNYFLNKTLKLLGCQPIFDCCCHCGKTNDIIAYDLENNGFVCMACYEDNLKYLTNKNILNYLYGLDKNVEIENNSRYYDKYVFTLLIAMVNDNAGLYLQAAKYIY